MVETSALKHRASNVARLMATRQLVALRLESKTHTLLLVERDSLRSHFLFLAGPRPKVTELFRGNAVDLVLERTRLRAEASKADIVAAPWKFFEERADTLRWYPFLDAQLAVAATLDDQIRGVPLKAHQKRLRAVGADPAITLRLSHAPRDFERFYKELYVPHQQRIGATPDEKPLLEESFRDGGALGIVEGRGRKLLAAVLLLIRRRGTLTFHRTGFAATTPAQLAYRSTALELLAFRHAQQLGFALLDFGFAPSVLTHPLFLQKRRLGCTFSPTPSSPALMLSVKRALRPSLFSRFPLLTGEPGAFVVQAGLSRSEKVSGRTLNAWVRAFDVVACDRVRLSTDATPELSGRVLCERALREAVPRLDVEVDEV